MKATNTSLLFIKGTETKYVIPYFQRGYVWEKENWEQLLNDMLNVNSSHFLGSFIIKEIKRDNHDFAQRQVIDGQQRITTLSILFRAVYDSVSEEVKNKIIDNIFSFLFVQKDATEDWKTDNIEDKLVPGINDKDVYKIIINNPEKINTIDKNNRIRRCYEFFISQLDETKAKYICNLISKSEINFVVKIDLDPTDNEQAIFDTTNSTGVKLTCADIIKNDLFYRFPESARETIYKNTWSNVFDGDDYDYWLSNYNKRSNIENLLFAVSEMELKEVKIDEKGKIKNVYIYDPYEDTYDVLSKKYKEFFDKKENELDQFLNRLIKYANIYKNNLVLKSDDEYDEDHYISRFVLLLNRLQVSTVLLPYLLKVFFDKTDDKGEVLDDKESELKDELYKIECLLLRSSICERAKFVDDNSKPSQKNFNKSIIEVINNSNINNLFTDKQIETIGDNEKVKEGLKNISNNTAAITIFLLDLKELKKLGGQTPIKHYPYNYELEHIMPQKYMEHWGLPTQDENGNDISSLDAETRKNLRSEYVYQIGNMTIITPEMNKKISNRDIGTKMHGDQTKIKKNGEFRKGYQGYDLCATEPLSEKLKNIIINAGNVWNEKMIKERTKELTDEILKYWPSI